VKNEIDTDGCAIGITREAFHCGRPLSLDSFLMASGE
jgi:hypothetical protein